MILWVLVHLMMIAAVSMAMAFGGPGLRAEPPPVMLPVWTLAATAALILIDLRRRKELMLLHNLGTSTSSAVTTATIPAVVGELALLLLG